MLDALVNVLNGYTDIPFVEMAWSHSPDSDYGVVSLDDRRQLDADENPVAETMLAGFVDVFVRKATDAKVKAVDDALNTLGIFHKLNSVQYENDTGLTHFEWIWLDTLNVVTKQLYVITFKDGEGNVVDTQIVKSGETPTEPSIDPYEKGGLTYRHYGWNTEIVQANENAVYDATYYLAIRIIVGADEYYYAMNLNADWLTDDQVATVNEWYAGGNVVGCERNNVMEPAIAVNETYLMYKNGTYTMTALFRYSG